MRSTRTLLAFAALLGGVFVIAGFAGSKVDPDRGNGKAGTDSGHMAPAKSSGDGMAMGEPKAVGHGNKHGAETKAGGHGGQKAASSSEVPGLAVSSGSLTLDLATKTAERAKPFPLRFRVLDQQGMPLQSYDVEHTKRMHLIVVRRDLTGFQHLHPKLAKDGTWSTRVTLPEAGTYRVFADFATAGNKRTLGSDLQVDGTLRNRSLPRPVESVVTDGGYRVTLANGAAEAGKESQLRFAVSWHGQPIQVGQYLGARGHLVALREGDLAFLHVHPDANSLAFMAEFPSAGRYRLFLQFKVKGQVHTAAFTETVRR